MDACDEAGVLMWLELMFGAQLPCLFTSISVLLASSLLRCHKTTCRLAMQGVLCIPGMQTSSPMCALYEQCAGSCLQTVHKCKIHSGAFHDCCSKVHLIACRG